MASLFIDGLDEFINAFDGLYNAVDDINSEALFKGAGIIADGIDEQINNIPNSSLLNEREREDLHKGLCVGEHIHNNGQLYTWVDFAGYTAWKWDGDKSGKYDQGIPIRLIARSVSRGVQTNNIHRQGCPFVQKGFKAKKKEAEEEMKHIIEDAFENFLDSKK